MATAVTDVPADEETRISCYSKRSLDEANERVFTSVDDVIGNNSKWSDEQKDKLRRRFREVYKNVLHENSTVDGQSWAEAVDDIDTTKESEPVDLKKKGDAEQMAADLDALIVTTVAKRKEFPPKLTQLVAKKLKCLHMATEQYKPVLPKSIEDPSPIMPKEDEEEIKSRISMSSNQLSVLSRLLPELEDKSERLQESINIHTSLVSNETHQVVTKPLTGESKMARSLTPLQAQDRADATPLTIPAGVDAVLKRQRLTAQLHNHPIKRYKSRTPPVVETS